MVIVYLIRAGICRQYLKHHFTDLQIDQGGFYFILLISILFIYLFNLIFLFFIYLI